MGFGRDDLERQVVADVAQQLSADTGQAPAPEHGVKTRRQPRDPAGTIEAAKKSMAIHVRAMLDFRARGVPTLDYGNNIRGMARETGVENAFDFPGFVPAYIRPLFCRGVGPFRWAALSGDPDDIYRTDEKVRELIPDNPHLHNWLDMAREHGLNLPFLDERLF